MTDIPFDALLGKTAALFVNGTPLALLIALVIVILRATPDIAKIRADSDGSLHATQAERIKNLEDRLDRADQRHDQEMDLMRKAMAAMRDDYEAKLAAIRQELNNETVSLDTLIMLLRANPDRVAESLDQVEQLRARQRLELSHARGAKSA